MHKLSAWSHNWLVLKRNNEALSRNQGVIRGVVYDFGCGIRPYEDDILKVADKYIGVDWSSSLHGLHADIVADLNQPLPIDNEAADSVVSFQVMEHLCEPQTMLNEAQRILKPDGTVFVTVPWQWWIHEAPYDFYRYTPFGLKYLFEKAGFVDIKVEAQSGVFSMLVLKVNYLSIRIIRGPRPLRWFIRGVLVPIWYVGQQLAPLLDKLDRNWEAETIGYYVTARKPATSCR